MFRRDGNDLTGPLDHHVPEGPPVWPLPDPVTSRTTAEQAAQADVDSGAYDAIGLAHEAPLLWEYENDALMRQYAAQAQQLKVSDLVMGAAIEGLTDAEAATAEVRLGPVTAEMAQLEAVTAACTADLQGLAPYENSIWKAPERIAEPRWHTRLSTWGVPAVLLPIELGVNVLALQLLRGGLEERLSFAVVTSAASIWAGHSAGVWTRERRGEPALKRWVVPTVLAVLVLGLVALMAALRVAYIDGPGDPDPLTGQVGPGLLEQDGIPSPLVWCGIGAVQLIFFVITVLHSARVHNPRVRALQAARARLGKLNRRHTDLLHAQLIARNTAELAASHIENTERLWDCYAESLAARSAERLAVYASTFARLSGNPDITVALEARLARSWTLRRQKPPEEMPPPSLESVA